jgi:hypothetical protein
MLKTDASKIGVAGLMLQQQKGDWKLVTCCSRKLTKYEENYGITHLEGLAIIYSVKKLRNYLLGKPFDVIVDHCALCVLNKNTPLNDRLRRWAIVLSEFDLHIKYTKGGLHRDVDCLSRAPVNNEDDDFMEDKVYRVFVPDDEKSWVLDYEDNEEAQKLLDKARFATDGYKTINGVLYKNQKLYVPEQRREEILKQAHGSHLGGHGGVRVTKNKLMNYHWPSLAEDVDDFVSSCESCQMRKTVRGKQHGRMFHHEAHEPLEVVGMDAWHTNKATLKSNKIILVAIDHFTKYMVAKALPALGGAECSAFLSEFVAHFGIPKSVLSDNAPEFKCVIFAETLNAYGIKQLSSTPGHSQGNSITERCIGTLQDRLASATGDTSNKEEWDVVLPAVVFAINTSVHTTTRYTPYELMFGREAPLRLEGVNEESDPRDIYAKMLKQHLDDIRRNARNNTATAQIESEPRFEASRKPVEFDIGDQVLSRNAGRRDDSKTGPKYQGPFEVTGKKDDVYDLKLVSNNKRYKRHVASLKKYHERDKSFSTNLLMALAAILALMSVMTTVDCQFDPQPAVVYVGTDSVVELRRSRISLAIGFAPPCSRISIKSFAPTPPGEIKEDRKGDMWALYSRRHKPDKYDASHKGNNYYIYDRLGEMGERLGLEKGTAAHDVSVLQGVTDLMSNCIGKWTNVMHEIENFNMAMQSTRSDLHERTKRGTENGITHANNTVSEDSDPTANITSITLPGENGPITLDEDYINKASNNTNAFRLWRRYYGRRPPRRPKRGVFGSTAAQAAKYVLKEAIGSFSGGVAANIVTDLVRFTWEYLDPHSATNRLTNMEHKYNEMWNKVELHEAIIDLLVNKTTDIERQLQLESLKRKTSETNRDRMQLIKDELNKYIDGATDALRRLTVKKQTGLIDMRALSDLTHNDDFLFYDERFTNYISDKLNPADSDSLLTLLIEFDLHDLSHDTFIAQVKAFKHWDITRDPPQLLDYRGEDYLIFNESANCARALSAKPPKVLFDSCTEPNYIDEKLQEWDVRTEMADPRTYNLRPDSYQTNRWSYIYCYPHWIKLHDKNLTCPNTVFRIPIGQKYLIPGHNEWNPAFKRMKVEIRAGEALDYIHDNQLLGIDEIRNENSLENQVIALRAERKAFNETMSHNVIVTRGFVWWVGISTIIVIISTIATILCWCCRRYGIIERCCLALPTTPRPREGRDFRRESFAERERPTQQVASIPMLPVPGSAVVRYSAQRGGMATIDKPEYEREYVDMLDPTYLQTMRRIQAARMPPRAEVASAIETLGAALQSSAALQQASRTSSTRQ